MKRYWAGIGDLMGRRRRGKSIDKLLFGDLVIDKESEMAEVFNNHFATVATNLERELPPPPDDIPPAALIPMHDHTFYLFPVSPEECERIISQLKNVSYGRDSLSTRLLKMISHFVSHPLSKLINDSFNSGVFPSDLKLAIITPIYKKNDPNNFTNYRPISVLPLLSKIFEKAFANRMSKFLYKYKIITPHQFGFQRGKSTCNALTALTDCIYNKLNEKKHTVALFLDLCKAYDTVNHSILLDKLFKYGFRGVSLDWLRSYLKDRQHCVRIGNAVSSRATINISIPQGSILGCIMFSLYNNDLPAVSDILKPILFADDTALLHSDSNFNCLIQNFNVELIRVNNWLLKNRLTLNVDKTIAMIFTKRKHAVSNLNKLCIADKDVEFESRTKYLGVTLDENLSFKDHISNLCVKVSKSIGIMYRISYYVQPCVIRNMYNALIYPLLTYCILVWGGSADIHLNSLLILQKKIVRIITKSNYLDHSEPLFKQTGTLKIGDLYYYSCLVAAFKIRNTFSVAAHGHETRNSTTYCIPSFQRLAISQRSLSYVLPYKYNNIPTYLKDVDQWRNFKPALVLHLINSYQH